MSTAVLQALNDEMTQIVNQVRRSLVQITNGQGGLGSGTIWRSDGLIITNAHVLPKGQGSWRSILGYKKQLKVILADGQALPAQVIGQDAGHDLAALSVAGTNLPAITLSPKAKPQPGEWVMGLGHPWGVSGAVTAGAVIDVGYSVEGVLPQRELIQVGLHLRPGHSGGPLVDDQGHLIGISTMINGPDVGLAIPLRTIQAFVQTILWPENEGSQPLDKSVTSDYI